MFNVADVFEFVVDGFNERPFPQQDFVVQVHERVLHVLLEFGHKVYVVNEETFKKLLAYVASIGKNLAEKPLRKVPVLQWLTVVHVPGREHPLYYLATVVYHYMQLEPVEPSHRTLALGGPIPSSSCGCAHALYCMTSTVWSR